MLDIFTLLRNWFNWCFENPEMISPNHTALYVFCIEHCNRLGWKEKFGLPTTMAMEAIGIKSYSTYKKTIDDLVSFGFIKMIEVSKNQYSANIIALTKNDKALNKALDKATIKHTSKRSEIIIESNDSIDIHNTIIQNTACVDKKDSNNAPTQILGVNYRPKYEDTNEEFRKMYDKGFYDAWLSINSFLDENCKYLRNWDNQLTISEFKKMYDRILKKDFNISQARTALQELDGSRKAKDNYNSVYHGFNTFIKTILKGSYV